jgi:ubiquinone/menaquinone biosynthesis C-methylase UbiE
MQRLVGHAGKLLDIGCGQGYFVKLASEHGWQAEGIEVSAPEIKYARDVFKLKVYDKPLELLSIPENTYDAVTLWRVLDQLPQPRKELERIYKILKPGGIVWIRVYNFDYHYPAAILGQLPFFKRNAIEPGIVHPYGINANSLRTVLAATGFKDITIKNSPLTKGDPYGSGGIIGKNIIAAIKLTLTIACRLVEVLSFGKLLKSSSLIAYAKKEAK